MVDWRTGQRNSFSYANRIFLQFFTIATSNSAITSSKIFLAKTQPARAKWRGPECAIIHQSITCRQADPGNRALEGHRALGAHLVQVGRRDRQVHHLGSPETRECRQGLEARQRRRQCCPIRP